MAGVASEAEHLLSHEELMELQRRRDDGKKLLVRFEKKAKLNKLKSFGGIGPDGKPVEGAGRPIFDEVVYIEKVIPGDKQLTVHREMRDSDREEFAEQYRAWLGRGENLESGMPLSQWPGISVSQVEELSFFKVRTVEQLAGLSDDAMGRMGGPGIRQLSERARLYVETAKGNAPVEALKAQLDARAQEIEALKQMVKDQAADLAELKQQRAKGK